MPLHSRALSCDDSAPRRARAWVAELMRASGRWGDDTVHDAILCASELVTSALVAHSTTMVVRLLIDDAGLRLSLVDDGELPDDQDDPAQRVQWMGFRLVDAVADRWGIDATSSGRELWVEFHAQAPQRG
ncbi:MAG TPA: ATP-binding protein [Jatrophihabitans sp.]|nr:ATP-binding protein [Jatrophihabitans sp.]